jgi:hypothetical protein
LSGRHRPGAKRRVRRGDGPQLPSARISADPVVCYAPTGGGMTLRSDRGRLDIRRALRLSTASFRSPFLAKWKSPLFGGCSAGLDAWQFADTRPPGRHSP